MSAKRAGVALFAALAFALPAPVRADDAAVAGNQLLAAQLLDAVTTRDLLTAQGRISYERNPVRAAVRQDQRWRAGLLRRGQRHPPPVASPKACRAAGYRDSRSRVRREQRPRNF
jgi:hypothetical protein